MITAAEANRLSNEHVGEQVLKVIQDIEKIILKECAKGCKCAFAPTPTAPIRSMVVDQLKDAGYDVSSSFDVLVIKW